MAILTKFHSVELANNFVNEIISKENSYYCFVAKPTPWLDSNGNIDDTSIPLANGSLEQTQLSIYHDLVYGKLLTNLDVAFMIPRHNWANGTIYSSFNNQDPDLYDKSFYVINNTNDVFKCISNGRTISNPNGVPSTYLPSIKQTTGTFKTSDGYIWKYMFTCDPLIYSNFQTASYIPVTPNNSVLNNAVPGTIDTITILNGGKNYQVYETGFLQNIANNYVVQLPTTSAPFDNYYTGSAIYLKNTSGAGQIRTVTSYSGLSKLLSVNPPFDLYENINLSNINGQINLGDIITQYTSTLIYSHITGFFNSFDTIIQSDTGSTGIIRTANTTTFSVETAQINSQFSLNYPIYNTAYGHVVQSGTVNIANNSFYVSSAANTNFSNSYMINSFIRVGNNANTNVRRVTSVNNSIITVDYPFNNSLNGAPHYIVPAVASIESVSFNQTLGSVIYTNLNSSELSFANTEPLQSIFEVGETVNLIDINNISQGANGIISFANTTNLILTNVTGTMNANLYLFGISSRTKVKITKNLNYPNITVDLKQGGFYSGHGIYGMSANGTPSSNAFVISSLSIPNELTEYVISPSVDIDGDGQGALAYAYVDMSGNNSVRAITDIKIINNGTNYTYANVSISSNNLYGDSFIAEAQVGPIKGHGANPLLELGANYVGINKNFGTSVGEGYRLPVSGSYRKIGIIKNPQINDVIFGVNNFENATMSIKNSTGVFPNGEIIIQYSSNSAGVVTYSNNNILNIKNPIGNFTSNNSNDNIVGLSSGITANVSNYFVNFFNVSANTTPIFDVNNGGSGVLTQTISNNQIRASNIYGQFQLGDKLTEKNSNTTAFITDILTSNGTVNSALTFGTYFVQTSRVTLTSNTKNYVLYETVTQDTSLSTGQVVSTINDIDIITANSTSFVTGDIIINTTTGANGIVISANSITNYIKIAGISTDNFNESTNKAFNVGDSIKNIGGNKTSIINNKYSVLNLCSVTNKFQIGNYSIKGSNSGAVSIASLPNSITQPDLIQNTGDVIYLENLLPFTRSSSSTEQVSVIISF